MNAILLYQPPSEELPVTPHGDPIIIHFGPGCTIAPHPRKPEVLTLITTSGGTKVAVRSFWKDVAKKAGYGDLLKEMSKSVRASDQPKQEEVAKPRQKAETSMPMLAK